MLTRFVVDNDSGSDHSQVMGNAFTCTGYQFILFPEILRFYRAAMVTQRNQLLGVLPC